LLLRKFETVTVSLLFASLNASPDQLKAWQVFLIRKNILSPIYCSARRNQKQHASVIFVNQEIPIIKNPFLTTKAKTKNKW